MTKAKAQSVMSTRADRRAALWTAAIFFSFWMVVMLAGADKPPPIGFLWVALTIVICSGIVFWRVPYYRRWFETKRKRRVVLVIGDGLVAGLIIALSFALFSSGEPSVSPRIVDFVIWFAVLGCIGVLNSSSIDLANTWWVKYRPFPVEDENR